jgi:hypothetical protein
LACQEDSSFSQGSDHGQATRHEARMAGVLEPAFGMLLSPMFAAGKTMN